MKICDFFETDLYSLLENVENVDFLHSKFDGNNYVINPTNSTINFSDNREIIHSLIKNQELISKLVKKQEVFLNKLIMKKY